MSTVSDICDAIGTARMMSLLRVSKGAISNARVADRFPARWFLIVNSECQRLGIECQHSLFAFTVPDSATDQSEDAA